MAIYLVGRTPEGTFQHEYGSASEALSKLRELQQKKVRNVRAENDYGDQISVSRLTFLANVDAHLNSLASARDHYSQGSALPL